MVARLQATGGRRRSDTPLERCSGQSARLYCSPSVMAVAFGRADPHVSRVSADADVWIPLSGLWSRVRGTRASGR